MLYREGAGWLLVHRDGQASGRSRARLASMLRWEAVPSACHPVEFLSTFLPHFLPIPIYHAFHNVYPWVGMRLLRSTSLRLGWLACGSKSNMAHMSVIS